MKIQCWQGLGQWSVTLGKEFAQNGLHILTISINIQHNLYHKNKILLKEIWVSQNLNEEYTYLRLTSHQRCLLLKKFFYVHKTDTIRLSLGIIFCTKYDSRIEQRSQISLHCVLSEIWPCLTNLSSNWDVLFFFLKQKV